jgi:hypothetical protein
MKNKIRLIILSQTLSHLAFTQNYSKISDYVKEKSTGEGLIGLETRV